MNGLETAQKGDLLTTTGKDVFEIVEVRTKKTFVIKDLKTQKTAVVEEDDPDAGKLVRIEIEPRINTDLRGLKKQKHKSVESVKSVVNKNSVDSVHSVAEKVPDNKNPYPGVSFNKKAPNRPWRGQFNRPPHYFSGQFATPEEARDAVEKKIKEMGLKPLRGMGKKKQIA